MKRPLMLILTVAMAVGCRSNPSTPAPTPGGTMDATSDGTASPHDIHGNDSTSNDAAATDSGTELSLPPDAESVDGPDNPGDGAVAPEMPPPSDTGSVLFCVDMSDATYPDADHDRVVANGSWNDWSGWGVELVDPDNDGRFCGVLDDLEPGNYEFVFAVTGPADNWSGWGITGNAPLAGTCDANPDDTYANYGVTVKAGVETSVCHGWMGCGCEDEPPPNDGTGSVAFCVNMGNAPYPNADYDRVVANGSWNDWGGWGVELTDPDNDGNFCGVLSGLEPGEYEFVFAVTGQADDWSGWGITGNAPLGGACDIYPGDSYANYGVTVVAGTEASLCHAWNGCGCSPGGSGQCGAAPGRPTPIAVNGFQVRDGTTPIHLKGVAWSPIPVGQGPGFGGPDWSGTVAKDASLMAAAGINVVRTYGPIMDTAVLDTLWEHGIYVLMTVFYGYAETPESAVNTVCALKHHPAILGWQIGNEWNYNNLGKDISFDAAVNTVAAVAAAIKDNDTTRPVATVYGGLPPAQVYNALSVIDVWGLNIYWGASFGNLFSQWKATSDKPMYLGEYGADAYNGQTNTVDEATQASFVTSLTNEIYANSSVNGSGPCIGGMVFEFNDEWWKYSDGSPHTHDTAPSWQNNGYPDPSIQEEWWGLVSIERTPRQAYDAYKALQAPTPN